MTLVKFRNCGFVYKEVNSQYYNVAHDVTNKVKCQFVESLYILHVRRILFCYTRLLFYTSSVIFLKLYSP